MLPAAAVASIVGPLNTYAAAGTVVKAPPFMLIFTVPPSNPSSVSMLWSKVSRALLATSPGEPTTISGLVR